MTARQVRIVGLTGLGAALCFVVGFIIDPTPPGAGAPAADVSNHIAQFGGRDRLAACLFALSAAGLIVLIAGVRQWLGEISTAPRWPATAMLAGGIVAASMLVSTSAIWFTLSSHAALSQETASVMSDAVNYGFVFAGFGVLVAVISGSAIMLATFGPLQILGRLGAVVAVLQIPYLLTAFFTSGPMQAGGLVSIICFSAAGLWFALLSLTLLWFARLAAAAARPARATR